MRFPEFSGEWEEHTLSEYLEFKNGLNPDAKRIGQGLPFISVMDILAEGVITYNSIRGKVEATDKEIDCFGVKNGDLLFQRSSETLEDVGRANVYMDSRTAVYGGFVIRGRKIGNYVPLFFKYLLATPLARKKTCRMGAGAQHFNIGQEGLSKISLSFPSVKEQEKIANLLSLIDERIATQNKIIEDLKKLKSAISKKLLCNDKWTTYKIQDIAEIGRGRVISSVEIEKQRHPLYPVYSSQTSNDGIMGYLDNYMFDGEYITWTTDGANAGTVFYRNGKFNCTNVCGTLKIHLQFDCHFVSLVLQQATQKYVSSNLANPKLMNNTMASIKIRMPDMETQKRLSKVFQTLDSRLLVHQCTYEMYLREKQYLLNQMFI
ncbi:restriction endonuclease subunit S [Bacteroides uniformis]|uniref:restriction endonuclease subunit S n=1 Tax=Bacteroides uniformis TaxID=820 RepID=UPI0039B67178